MDKKKRLLYSLLVFVAIVVFVIFYFKDSSDMAKVEKKQDADAVETAEELIDDLNSSFEDISFEEDSAEVDSVVVE